MAVLMSEHGGRNPAEGNLALRQVKIGRERGPYLVSIGLLLTPASSKK